ncbi:hypothetical protein [Maribellus sediminis]|uniref:hypothetical protein n=1 Tax=Maribellus sediminis TaxID=2696285 RepID=UPI00142F7B4C|nr:hypothetical protein [Maribellus sediminis]
MSELEDIKLQALLQSMQLDSPGEKFSARVMNRIFEEDSVFEKIKAERVLGRGFWTILVVFVVLLAAMFFMAGSGAQPQEETARLLPQVNETVSNSFNSFFGKIGSVPLSVAGILIASSILLFIDRIISSNSKIFAS